MILWRPKIHYRVQNSLPSIPIISQTNPIQTPKPYFPKINCIILLSIWPKYKIKIIILNSIKKYHNVTMKYIIL
jgi:hypothetical protein